MKKLNAVQRGLLKVSGVNAYVDNIIRQERDRIDMKGLTANERFELMENKAWYYGTPSGLEQFYKTNYPLVMYRPNNFWSAVNTTMVRTHSGFPKAISNAYGSLLFETMPEIRVDSRSQARSKKLQSKLDKILDVNDILNLLQEAAQLQSYSGASAIKLNIDPTLGDVPFLTAYPKEDFKAHRKHNQLVYIDFYDYYDDYTLVSRYGRGYITYSLFDDENREVELSTISSLAGLKDAAFYNDNMPVSNIFAAVIPNKSGDRSDYEGLASLFNSLDEAMSTRDNYIRNTKPITEMTEDLAPKNDNGETTHRSEFDRTVVILDTPAMDGAGTRYEREIPEIKIEGFNQMIENLQHQILRAVGLSPGTVGFSMGGARESGEALEIRERLSARSRAEKLSIWKEKFADLLESAIVLQEFIDNGVGQDNVFTIEALPEFYIDLSFTDYAVDTEANRAELYTNLYEAGLITLEYAVIRIFGDKMTKSQLLRMTIDLKISKGIELNVEEKDFLDRESKKSVKSQESLYNTVQE